MPENKPPRKEPSGNRRRGTRKKFWEAIEDEFV